jgi:uncharacterized protein YndB with AHSA1/START domain
MTNSAPHDDPSVLRLERTFGAPVARVFEAWTSAELLRRWYPPGADWDTPLAEVDLRVGGALRLVMRSPDGEEFGGGGHYREIRPPMRLVFTWRWDRRDVGAGMQLVEVDFSDNGDGTTTVVLTNRGLDDTAARESHREGWERSFDSLDRLLEGGGEAASR